MEMNQSEAVQMDTNVYQEDQVRKSKETEAHTVDSETHVKQQGLENKIKKEIHNGESRSCLNRIQ